MEYEIDRLCIKEIIDMFKSFNDMVVDPLAKNLKKSIQTIRDRTLF